MDASELIDFNPWWSSGRVPERLLEDKHRDLFDDIHELLPEKQIVSIVGLRRTGKTSLMYQVIDHLLEKGVPKEQILYFSFDKKVESLDKIVDVYKSEIIMEDTIQEKTYFLFDEIQKLDDWENQIKILYDKRLPLKLLLSGSSSLTLKTSGKETLAGRNYILRLNPLSFREYLTLKDENVPEFSEVKKTYQEARLDREKYITEFHRFIRYQGLPETIGMDEEMSRRYIKSSLVDQVVYKDIPSNYDIGNPSILGELLRIIAERPGMLLKFNSLASDLSRTRQTISKYIFYLENSFLLRLVYNYSGSFVTSAKKLKKVYFSHPSIVHSLNPSRENIGRLVENHIISESDIEFFYRRKQKEVDGILRDQDGIIPMEVKYKETIQNSDEKNILCFMDEEGLDKGLMITRETFEVDQEKLIKIPAYFFLIYKERILEDIFKNVNRD